MPGEHLTVSRRGVKHLEVFTRFEASPGHATTKVGAGGCQGGRSSDGTAPVLGFLDPSRRDIRRVQGELTGGPREGGRESPPWPTADLAAQSAKSSMAFMTRRRAP